MKRTSEIPIRQSITVVMVWMIFSACSLLAGVTSTPASATKRPTRTATRTSIHTTMTGLTPKGSLPTDTPGVQPTVNQTESGLPEDVPLYPGATGLIKLNAQAIEFGTSDTVDQVVQFYQQQMPAQKWTLVGTTKQIVSIVQVWQKDVRIVSISIAAQGGKTVVMITFQNS